jgi:uncharacterized phage protein (TIGR01671 family)
MRTIKFKVWDKLNKYFHYLTVGEDVIPVNEDYVFLQFTGLLDKNGVEIYEGDITKSEKQILFDDGMFIPFYDFGKQERIEDVGTNWWSKEEIIGNIYSNPELC